jgi:hypothetical protein
VPPGNDAVWSHGQRKGAHREDPSADQTRAAARPLLLVTGLLVSAPIGTAQSATPAAPAAAKSSKPRFTAAVGFDVSAPMRDVAKQATAARRGAGPLDRPERGPAAG